MSTRCPLALVGLPSTDRALIETLCTQSWRYGLAYEVVSDLSRAEMVVANADDADVLRNLRAAKLNVPVLLIGASDGGTGWVRLPRPIHLPAVIDAMTHLDPRTAGQALHASAPPPEASNSLFASLNQFTGGQSGVRPPPSGPRPAAAPMQSMPPTPPAKPVPPPVSVKLSTKGPALSFPPSRLPDREGDFAPTQAFSPSVLPHFADSTDSNGFKATQQLPARQATLGWLGRTRGGSGGDSQNPLLMWRDELVLPASKSVKSKKAEAPVAPPVQVQPDEGPPSQPGELPASVVASSPLANVLLVGSAHLAEGSLMRALLRLGYQVDYAQDAIDIQELLDLRQHRFVFVDDASLEGRTNNICRVIRDWSEHMRRPPHVVVVAAHNNWIRRWLAKMAGCHGWLVTPFRRRDLKRYLEKQLTQS